MTETEIPNQRKFLEGKSQEELVDLVLRLREENDELKDITLDLGLEVSNLKVLNLYRSNLLNTKHPLYNLIASYTGTDRDMRSPVLFLDENNIIRGMTRSARQVLRYRQKDGVLDFMDRDYRELIETGERKIMFASKVQARQRFVQKITVPNRKKVLTDIESKISHYPINRKGEVYGTLIMWKRWGWFDKETI